jgi:hypothetical protein
MQPGAALARQRRDLGEGVERAGVYVSRLRTDNARSSAVLQRMRKGIRLYSSLPVRIDTTHPFAAQAEHA